MKSIKEFAFGAFYLVSGVYSLGFGLFLDGRLGVSGNPAFVMTPDALFPVELGLFVMFGLVFLGASFFQFKKSFSMEMESRSLAPNMMELELTHES